MYEFIESSVFAKYVHDYLTDEEYAGLQWYLSSRPDAGDLIPASGGCRKLRWGATDKGKRGGVRVISRHDRRRTDLDAGDLCKDPAGESSGPRHPLDQKEKMVKP